jgi:hypothetical protein
MRHAIQNPAYRSFLACLFLTACSAAQPISTVPPASSPFSLATVSPKPSQTNQASPTLSGPRLTETLRPTPANATPTLAVPSTPTPRAIPPATLAAEATITAFGPICEAPAVDWTAELSPNGEWIAMACQGNDADVDSHLRVVSLHTNHEWVIHFADYANGAEFDRNDSLEAFHWSRDRRYLYVASPSKASGCCWIGHFRLLVRLNLENGRQTEVVNFGQVPGIDFSFSPSDRYFMYAKNQNLFILDLLTWSRRAIRLDFEHTGAGYALMSDDDEKIILMLREYPQEPQGDLTYGSLIVIDLLNGSQRKILTGLEYWDTPQPVRWTDAEHVLLSGDGQYWIIDINTAELTQTGEP